MNSTNTSTVLESNVFVPMNESQMAAVKGGDDAFNPDWDELLQLILDLIEEDSQVPDSVLSQIVEQFESLGLWGDVANDLESEGAISPPIDTLDDSVFMGGNGGL